MTLVDDVLQVAPAQLVCPVLWVQLDHLVALVVSEPLVCLVKSVQLVIPAQLEHQDLMANRDFLVWQECKEIQVRHTQPSFSCAVFVCSAFKVS